MMTAVCCGCQSIESLLLGCVLIVIVAVGSMRHNVGILFFCSKSIRLGKLGFDGSVC